MSKLFMTSGAFFGFLAVILGSYSAHALRGKITVDELNSFDTAVRYQMFHALALIVTGLSVNHLSGILVNWTGLLFLVGIILFSGSIVLMRLTGIQNFGMITPFGGVCFILGWLLLAITFFKQPN